MSLTITKLDVYPIRLPYDQPIADARSVITHKSTVFLRVETDCGCYGWGEAATYGDVPEIVTSVLRQKLFPLIQNRRVAPRNIAALIKKVTAHYGQRGIIISALSGLDIALWDLLGRQAGLPICTLLGGQPKEIRLYAGTGYYDAINHSPEKDLEKMKSSLERIDRNVFVGAKIKIGRYDLQNDIQRVESARQVLGDRAILIVDANNAFDLRGAVRLAQHIESNNITFLEEPIEFGRIQESVELRSKSPIPIAGYELEMTQDGFTPYIKARALDIIQPDCIWSGGLTECLNIAIEAERCDLKVVTHNFASPLSTAANYHLLCTTNKSDLLEIDATGSPLQTILFKEDNRLVKYGQMIIPDDCPGLGVEPDPKTLKELSLH